MKLKIPTEKHGVQEVLFDECDLELISGYKWHVKIDNGNLYASCYVKENGKYKTIRMHRLIMGVEKSDKPHIDHKNGNGLDNRRENLREATIAENTRNKGKYSTNTTGYKGVSVFKCNPNKFIARIKANGKNIYGGYFYSAIEAAAKANELLTQHHGEFAYLNHINEEELRRAIAISEAKINSPKLKNTISKCGYRGVNMSRKAGKNPYMVKVNKIYVGMFPTAEIAAKAYDEKAKEIFGEYAILNFNQS